MINFEIPWKISLEHVFALSLNGDPTNYSSKRYVPTNTLRASGDVSISQNWKIASTLLYNAETGKVSNLNFNLFRNIHCWNVGFNWTAIGTNKNFSVNLRANAAALSNVNVNLRKPPIVF